MDISLQPELLSALDIRLGENPPFVESKVLVRLRDMGLAAPSLVAIPELKTSFEDLCAALKLAYIESLDMSPEEFVKMDNSALRDSMSRFIVSLDDTLKDWAFSEIYDPALSDTRAYLDGGLAVAVFQDMLLINELVGFEDDIPEESRKDLMRSAIYMSKLILDAQASNTFIPPGRSRLSNAEFQQYLKDMATFPKFRHDQLLASDTTAAAYNMMFDTAAYFARDEIDDALAREEQAIKHKRIAIGVASVVSLGAAYLAWRLYTCNKQGPSQGKPEIDLDRPWELKWAYTDLPAGKP